MASFKISFKRPVKKDFRKIEKQQLPGILERIAALAENPRHLACNKLSVQNVYPVRQGSFRIIWEIFDEHPVVIVVAEGSRGSVYQEKVFTVKPQNYRGYSQLNGS